MVRNRPRLVPTILRRVFGMNMSDDGLITLSSESYVDFHPTELRFDATVLVDDAKKPRHGVVVESQTSFKQEKTFSWPAYLALLRLRHKCGATLLVFCPDEKSARACAKPIDKGHPEFVLKPLTVHPGMLPAITDPEQARRLPELAVLSAPAHADGPDAKSVLTSVSVALDALPGDSGRQYHDYLMTRFSAAARTPLEEITPIAGSEPGSRPLGRDRGKGPSGFGKGR